MRIKRISARAFLFLAVLLVVGIATKSSAQATVALVNNLTFGNVLPGIPKVIPKTSADSAAQFLITGTPGTQVTISFTLPKYMSSSGYNMQTIFKTTDCSMDSSAIADQASPDLNNVSPWRTTTYAIGSGGEIVVWLGGTVVPGVVQQSGSYSSDILIFVDTL